MIREYMRFVTLVFVDQERKNMKKQLFAGIIACAVLGMGYAIPAEAGCRDSGTCAFPTKPLKKSSLRKRSVKTQAALQTPRKSGIVLKKRKTPLKSSRNSPKRARAIVAYAAAVATSGSIASSAAGGRVVALIKAMAPGQGVPTWFALRIAQVESNYNAHLRGLAGEYGVFQMKCATAKGIGYRGDCSGLLDPRTNVQYGLRHLALAMKSSRGNLRLAASKHNGGLGRKTMVAGYVAKVF